MRKLLVGAAAGLLVVGCAKKELVRDEPIDDFVTRVRLAEPVEPALPEEEPEPAAEQVAELPEAELRTFIGVVRGLDGATLVLEDDSGSRREMLLTRQTRIGGEALETIAGRARSMFEEGTRVRAAYAIEGFDLVAREVLLLDVGETELPPQPSETDEE